MRRNSKLLFILFLILLTTSSYTLAKFTDKKTYVIGVNDLKYKDKEPPAQPAEENLDEESNYTLKDIEMNYPLTLLPEQIVEASYDGQVHDLSFNKKGIYAIQLYSGSSLFSDSLSLKRTPNYLAAYIESPENLQFYLGNHGTLTENDTDIPELGEASFLNKAGDTQPLMTISEEKEELNEAVLTRIHLESPLHSLLSKYQSNYERNYQGKIILTYLGTVDELKTIKQMNQAVE